MMHQPQDNNSLPGHSALSTVITCLADVRFPGQRTLDRIKHGQYHYLPADLRSMASVQECIDIPVTSEVARVFLLG